MKINLKKLAQQKEALKDVASTNQSNMYRKLLRELTSWIEEVETLRGLAILSLIFYNLQPKVKLFVYTTKKQ